MQVTLIEKVIALRFQCVNFPFQTSSGDKLIFSGVSQHAGLETEGEIDWLVANLNVVFSNLFFLFLRIFQGIFDFISVYQIFLILLVAVLFIVYRNKNSKNPRAYETSSSVGKEVRIQLYTRL